jgi:hypothetical protein
LILLPLQQRKKISLLVLSQAHHHPLPPEAARCGRKYRNVGFGRKYRNQFCPRPRGNRMGFGMTTERRGRWSPTQQQISLALDCAAARMPIARAAELLGVGPRTLWIFAKRVGLPVFDAWKGRPRYVPVSRATVAARTAISAAHPPPRKAVSDGCCAIPPGQWGESCGLVQE